MRKIGLRGALQKLGCTEIELHWNGGPACRDQSGFFTGGGEHGFVKGQTYYVTYSPDFSYGGEHVMYRTAEHRKDWHGGTNRWNFSSILNEIGYKLDGKINYGKPRW